MIAVRIVVTRASGIMNVMFSVTMPSLRRPLARRLRLAGGGGTYPISRITFRTLSAVSSETPCIWFNTRDTVMFDTPAF